MTYIKELFRYRKGYPTINNVATVKLQGVDFEATKIKNLNDTDKTLSDEMQTVFKRYWIPFLIDCSIYIDCIGLSIIDIKKVSVNSIGNKKGPRRGATPLPEKKGAHKNTLPSPKKEEKTSSSEKKTPVTEDNTDNEEEEEEEETPRPTRKPRTAIVPFCPSINTIELSSIRQKGQYQILCKYRDIDFLEDLILKQSTKGQLLCIERIGDRSGLYLSGTTIVSDVASIYPLARKCVLADHLRISRMTSDTFTPLVIEPVTSRDTVSTFTSGLNAGADPNEELNTIGLPITGKDRLVYHNNTQANVMTSAINGEVIDPKDNIRIIPQFSKVSNISRPNSETYQNPFSDELLNLCCQVFKIPRTYLTGQQTRGEKDSNISENHRSIVNETRRSLVSELSYIGETVWEYLYNEKVKFIIPLKPVVTNKDLVLAVETRLMNLDAARKFLFRQLCIDNEEDIFKMKDQSRMSDDAFLKFYMSGIFNEEERRVLKEMKWKDILFDRPGESLPKFSTIAPEETYQSSQEENGSDSEEDSVKETDKQKHNNVHRIYSNKKTRPQGKEEAGMNELQTKKTLNDERQNDKRRKTG